MKKFIFILLLLNFVFGQAISKYGNAVFDKRNKLNESLDVTDRKFADHNGNRVLCRIYNFGGIGDLSSNVSGIYPFGSGHSYFYDFHQSLQPVL